MKEGKRAAVLGGIVQFGIQEARQLVGQGRGVGRKDLSLQSERKRFL